ncbi:MAG: SIS domain-containing protein [Candidatus Omnitrophica bacterium]|nr:SIS domain-containing protein [Candidatus Omnitrophota bacterium]
MTNEAQAYFASLGQCLANVEAWNKALKPIELTAALKLSLKEIYSTKSTGGKVIYLGNGGSASIASHQAVDLWKNGGIRAIAFNDSSLLTCVANDYGYEHVFEKPIEMFADQSDLLIAISSSGASQNILRAVDTAKAKGCFVITMSGFRTDNPLRTKGNLNFYIPSRSYGFVEISHLTLCHYLADRIMTQKETPAPVAGKK